MIRKIIDHTHNDLRENSKHYMTEQEMDKRVNVNMTDNFDINLFNKIYDENKISTPFDDGYGEWMKKTETPFKKLFNGNFNNK